MESIVIILLIVIIIIIISSKNELFKRITALELNIHQLKRQLEKVTAPSPVVTTEQVPVQIPEPIIVEPIKKAEADYWESGFKVVEETENADPILAFETALQPETVSTEEQIEEIPSVAAIQQPIITEPVRTTKAFFPPEEKLGFFDRNPDLEKFIGENLISKVGIAILVLAIAYFVKFAIDNNWIGAIGRVGIGLLCGAILIVAAHRLQQTYKAFSSVLIGGGLAVFYFTITLAYQEFHLFNQTAAFIILVLITAFAVLLSLLYDREEVAIIALVGGFASPFMASNGSGNYQTLFIYLLILNSALLAIAFKKGWRLLNLLAFIFTTILYHSWLFLSSEAKTTSIYKGGFLFASIFYLQFFAINLLHNIKENKKFIASDFGIILVNTGIYFGIGLLLLDKMDATIYKGLFCIVLAIFNLIVTYSLFKSKKVDINILYLLIGITLTFISLTAPIQLHGHYITLFWASETVLLYWLYLKSNISIVQRTSMIIWGAMLMSLWMDWQNIYDNTEIAITIFFNKGFIAGIYCSIATLLLYNFSKLELVGKDNLSFGYLQIKQKVLLVGIILLFLTGFLEIRYQFEHYYPNEGIALLYSIAYINLFILLITSSHLLSKEAEALNKNKPYLLSASIILYLITLFNTSQTQITLLQEHKHLLQFSIHWVTAIIIGIFLYRLINLLRCNDTISEVNQNTFTWIICGLIVCYFSVEINLLVNLLFYSKTNTIEAISDVYIKTILPILWGICSFAFMWFGMNYKYKKLRIISLSLFLVTLLKLFIFDLSNIPIAGKIAAFFCLGVLLLVVSFMYQRLKKIIIEDEKK